MLVLCLLEFCSAIVGVVARALLFVVARVLFGIEMDAAIAEHVAGRAGREALEGNQGGVSSQRGWYLSGHGG